MPLAKDIMTPGPTVCAHNQTIYEAVAVMEEENCGSVPIVDAQDRLCGIVTDRDIALALGTAEEAIDPRDIRLEEVMTEDPVAAMPEDELQTIVRMMEDNQVRRIPIVDQSRHVVGIIAQADIATQIPEEHMVAEVVSEISKD
jgi:CBS domain-containing protein